MILRRYTCRTVQNMLPLHVGGDLDPRHTPSVDRHLSSCLVCFREFRELASMRSRLGVLASQPLPAGILDGFAEEVMARIHVGEPGPAARAPSPGPHPVWMPRLAAAAAILLVGMAGWRVFDDSGRSLGEQQLLDGSRSVAEGVIETRAAPVPVSPEMLGPSGGAPGLAADPSGRSLAPAGSHSGTRIGLPDAGLQLPDAVQIQIRLRGGRPGQVFLLSGGASGGLQVEDGRKPRVRDP